ncbi:MAG: nucleotidyl transferase AbiEii/AbiGii toxin family protein [Nitriliruptor sp.]|uniref:nucleotidyl transferase AbiEii/AbiGii toxin family protein n=1 Tax=Nitriliruptor sp. TaxID=2448056 RepID=UPI0034A02B17
MVTTGSTDQLTALRDAVRALTTTGIRVVLIGGLAVGVRSGVPRATIDVDLAAYSRVERRDVGDALIGVGFEHRGSFAHSENFRHRNGEPVQVAFDARMDGAIERAGPVAIDGGELLVVGTEDLIAMKQRAGNDPSRRRSKALRDLADAELLREGADGGTDDGW